MRWKSAQWPDKALIVSLFCLFLNANGSIAGIQLFPVPALLLRAFVPFTFLMALLVKRDFEFDFYWKETSLFCVAAMFLVFGSFRSVSVPSSVDNELINALYFVLCGLIFMYFAKYKIFELLEDFVALSFGIVGVFAAIFGLIKLNIDSGGGVASFVTQGDDYPLGASLVKDYNMYSLMVGLGVLGLFFLSRNSANWMKWIVRVPATLFALVPIFTFSRRYFLFFILVVVVAFIAMVIDFKRSDRRLTFLQKSAIGVVSATSVALISLFVLVILGEVKELPGSGPGISQLNVMIARFATIGEFSSTVKDSRGNLLERGISILDERDPIEFLAGGNFDYLELISTDNHHDYPHNPFVSAWLYGGFVAFVCVALVIFLPLRYFLVAFKEHFFFCSAYLMLMFFLLISGNTYASTLYLGFFGFLGLVLHRQRQRDLVLDPVKSDGYSVTAS